MEDRKKFINKTTRSLNIGQHHYGGPKFKIRSVPPDQNLGYHLPLQNFNFSLEIFIPGKRSKHQKNKQHPILIPPQQNSTTMKHLVSLSMIKVFAQVDIFGGIFILTRFCYGKRPGKRLMQNSILKVSHKEQKGFWFILLFLMTMLMFWPRTFRN